ncbi:MAG: hypothetical protein JWO01_2278 [Microbacteriaceae bacterium]|nr:hypothetical protein [Microbacteriaceae bacterium]
MIVAGDYAAGDDPEYPKHDDAPSHPHVCGEPTLTPLKCRLRPKPRATASCWGGPKVPFVTMARMSRLERGRPPIDRHHSNTEPSQMDDTEHQEE